MDVLIFIAATTAIILSIIMIIKFFQIASDVSKIRNILADFFSKNESEIVSEQVGDLNDPKVLENMLSVLEKQKTESNK